MLDRILILTLFIFSFGKNVFNVKNYGARGDGITKDTEYIKNALSDLKEKCQRNCTLLFPKPGTYLTGPFNLTSNMILYIEKDATILASDDENEYPAVAPLPSYGKSRDTGGFTEHHPFIYGYRLANIEINGEGTFNGNGDLWWKKKKERKLKHGRPRFIHISFSRNLVIRNIKVKSTPFWAIHPYACDNVKIENVDVYNIPLSPNTDGINPDSSTNVLISNCRVTSGDDHIAIKSGMDDAGLSFNRPTVNVTIKDCVFGTGAGIALGSEMSGGIRNVYVKNTIIRESARGLVIKTARGRGNVIENITFQNITITSCLTYAIYLNMFYQRKPPTDPRRTPKFKNITFKDIKGSSVWGGQFVCLPESPCENIQMENIKFETILSWNCENVRGRTNNVVPKICF